MTVRTQDTQVFYSIVGFVAVDVIKLQGGCFSAPLDDLAAFALSLFDTESYEPSSKTICVPARVLAQHLLDWACVLGAAKFFAFGPAFPCKMRRRQCKTLDVSLDSAVASASNAESQFANHLGGCTAVAHGLDELRVGPQSFCGHSSPVVGTMKKESLLASTSRMHYWRPEEGCSCRGATIAFSLR